MQAFLKATEYPLQRVIPGINFFDKRRHWCNKSGSQGFRLSGNDQECIFNRVVENLQKVWIVWIEKTESGFQFRFFLDDGK